MLGNGSPITRGSSFDIAASSVLPPYSNDFMSYPSFSTAYGPSAGPSSSVTGSLLGQSLSRMNSLDPYTYAPVWTASGYNTSNNNSTSSTGGNNQLLNTVIQNISASGNVPLLDNTPYKDRKSPVSAPSITGLKRESDNSDDVGPADLKKTKTGIS